MQPTLVVFCRNWHDNLPRLTLCQASLPFLLWHALVAPIDLALIPLHRRGLRAMQALLGRDSGRGGLAAETETEKQHAPRLAFYACAACCVLRLPALLARHFCLPFASNPFLMVPDMQYSC